MSLSIAMVAALLGVSLQAQQPALAPKAAAPPAAKEAPRTPKARSDGPSLAPVPTSAGSAPAASSYLEGVWAEEAKGDEPGAIEAYTRRVAAFDAERPRAARTVEQLAEALLKQGRLQEAKAQYLRLAREFSDLPGFAQLAQSRGAELGVAGDPGANSSVAIPVEAAPTQAPANPKLRALLDEELALVEQQIELAERQFKAGEAPAIELMKLQRDALQLKQKIAAAEGPEPSRERTRQPAAESKPEAPGGK